MHRIDTPNARPDANGAGKAGYHLNTDMSGVDPTALDPAALNAIQEEICGVIESQSIALVKGTNNQLLTAIQRLIVDVAYPVHRTIEFATDIDPNDLWDWTTWVRFAEGQTTVGYKNDDVDFGAIGDTGGAKGHKMTLANLIEHSHKRNSDSGSENVHTGIGGGAAGDWSGSSGYIHAYTDTKTAGQADPDPIPTLMPYRVSAKWVRTA